MTLACGELKGGQLRLTRAGDGGPIGPEARFSAVLASREDFDVRIVDLPPVADREVEGLIRFRLRSTYPGNPNDTSFDYRLIGHGKARRAVVFICSKRTLEEYRSAARRRPLLLPYLLVARLARRLGDVRVWALGESWAELMVFQSGLPASSEIHQRNPSSGFDLTEAEQDLADDVRALPVFVVATRADIDAIKGGMRTVDGAAKSRLTFLPIDDLARTVRKADALFSQKRRTRSVISPVVRLGVLSAAAAVLAMLVFFKYVVGMEQRAEALKQQATALELANQRIIALQQEVEEVSTELSRLEARRPQDLYLLLSELSAVLDGEAVIRSLTVRENGFQIEAVGRNSLQLMEGIRTRGSFSGVKLSQVVPESGSAKERFSFSGVFDVR